MIFFCVYNHGNIYYIFAMHQNAFEHHGKHKLISYAEFHMKRSSAMLWMKVWVLNVQVTLLHCTPTFTDTYIKMFVCYNDI